MLAGGRTLLQQPPRACCPSSRALLHPVSCWVPCPADELQRNLDRLMSELAATRQEVQQLSEELLALHEHADLETAQVRLSSCSAPGNNGIAQWETAWWPPH